MVLLNVVIFIMASLVLVKSASYAVRHISAVANNLRFSEFFIAFVIAGFVSIMPEFFIGINSAFIGSPELGLGTVIGSNIADLTLVIGFIALVGKKINADTKILKNNLYFLIVTSLPILLMIDGNLSRDDGIFLVLSFSVYMWHLIKKEKMFSKRKAPNQLSLAKNIVYFIASMAVLFLSAHLIVENAVIISVTFLIPSIIVGLFIVSIGTTLPELTFSLRAVLAKHKEIAFGDILGNVAVDSTLTIGVMAIIRPISTDFSVFATSAFFMIFAALTVAALLQAEKKVTWKESFLLFLIYAFFVLIELKLIA